MLKLYAQAFGIGDLDILEAPWLEEWIQRHADQLRYVDRVHRWFWIGE